MKKFINKTADGENLLLTLNAELGSPQVLTASLEITPTVITAHDAGDIAVLNASSYENYEPEYIVSRRAEYPDIGDQLDALYHADVFPADMKAILKAVKDKYPKE